MPSPLPVGILRELVRTPLARVPAFLPLAAADWRMGRFGRRVNAVLHGIAPEALDGCSENGLRDLLDSAEAAQRQLDSYLEARGETGVVLASVRRERNLVADAVGCLRRGYVPGALPSVPDRLALGERRLRGVL